MAHGVGGDAVGVVHQQHADLRQGDVAGLLERPGGDELRILADALGRQPALVGLSGLRPEGLLLTRQQQVAQLQGLLPAAIEVDEGAPRHAVGAAGEAVARQLDENAPIVLLEHLGLQVAAPARFGAGQKVPLVALQRGRQRHAFGFAGQLQQALVDQPVQRRLVGEMHGVDVHQRALAPLASGLQMFPGRALVDGRRVRGREALAGSQEQGESGEGERFHGGHSVHLGFRRR